MKKLLIALALCAATSALAQVHHDVIFERCADEHKRGVCRALIDKADYPPGATRFVGGKWRSFDAYIRIRNAKEQMCTRARAYCRLRPNGDECFEAQVLWGEAR